MNFNLKPGHSDITFLKNDGLQIILKLMSSSVCFSEVFADVSSLASRSRTPEHSDVCFHRCAQSDDDQQHLAHLLTATGGSSEGGLSIPTLRFLLNNNSV